VKEFRGIDKDVENRVRRDRRREKGIVEEDCKGKVLDKEKI
jgi:hypothetical protein